jgi:hypothetical protein
MVNNYKYNILIFSILCFYISCDIAKIEIFKGPFIIKTLFTGFEKDSIKNLQYNQEDIIYTSGKICSQDSVNKVIDDCFLKYQNFNYDWVHQIFIF